MSRRGEIIIECESEDCYAEIIYGAAKLNESEVDQLLAEDGWERKDGFDYCPDCCKAENLRERGDDDGREYGHPGDRLAGRE